MTARPKKSAAPPCAFDALAEDDDAEADRGADGQQARVAEQRLDFGQRQDQARGAMTPKSAPDPDEPAAEVKFERAAWRDRRRRNGRQRVAGGRRRESAAVRPRAARRAGMGGSAGSTGAAAAAAKSPEHSAPRGLQRVELRVEPSSVCWSSACWRRSERRRSRSSGVMLRLLCRVPCRTSAERVEAFAGAAVRGRSKAMIAQT